MWFLLLLVAACGDDVEPPAVPDGGRDAGGVDAAPPLPEAELPAPPVLTPCPSRWREIADPEGAVPALCDPWPEGGPSACPDGQMQLPGEVGCRVVGTDCAPDGFPTGLPPAADVVFVRAGAAGGDGTRADPFGTVGEAVSSASAGAIVAIAAGRYEETVDLLEPMTLWGACAETVLSSDAGGPVIASFVSGVVVRNLRISECEAGIWVRGGTVTIEDVVIEDVRDNGISVFIGGRVDAHDLLIRRAQSGVNLGAGGDVSFAQVEISETFSNGLTVSGGTATVVDSVIRAIGSPLVDADIVAAFDGSSVTFERVAVDATNSTSILAVGGDIELQMSDVVLVAPAGERDFLTGGLVVLGGAHAVLERVRLERTRVLGLGVAEPTSSITATDVLVREVLPLTTTDAGHGMEVGAGAEAWLTRVRFDRSHGLGVLVDGVGSTLRLEDASVVGTRSRTRGDFGRALQVQRGGQLSGLRVRAADGHELGVVAATAGSGVVLQDLTVTGTLPRGCADEGCPPAGIGVAAYESGAVSLEGFRIADNDLAGIQIASGGQMDLSGGVVSGHPVGANVQDEGFDVTRLTLDVFYVDNEVNLDSSALPIPDPIVPL